MNNFKPLALASVISLMSVTASAQGPVSSLLNQGAGGQSIGAVLNTTARSIQPEANSRNPVGDSFGRTNTPTLVGVTVFEPADSQNADIAALSVGSGDNTGNGGAIGVAVLAGENSGSGGVAGVSALNTTEAATVTLGGSGGVQEGTGGELAPLTSHLDDYRAGQMNKTLYTQLGREELMGAAATEQLENNLRSMQAAMTNEIGSGGSTDDRQEFSDIGLVSLSGFEGDNAASGSDIGVAAFNSGTGSAHGEQVGVAALAGDNAARGDLANIAIVGGDNSAQGGLINVAALSGSNSAQGGVVNVQVANEPTTTVGNDEAALNLAVLHRSNNVEQGTVGIGIITIAEAGTTGDPLFGSDVPAAAEAEKCGGAVEVMIRGLPVIAGPRLGTQFADSRAETKTGECSKPVELALAGS